MPAFPKPQIPLLTSLLMLITCIALAAPLLTCQPATAPAQANASSETGRARAAEDIKAGKPRLLYYGRPWSAGKALIDDATGLPVQIVAGCDPEPTFAAQVDAYNTAIRLWAASQPAASPASQSAASRPDGHAELLFALGLDDQAGWIDIGKRNLAIELCADDKVEEGFYPIGSVAQRAAMSLPQVYQQAAAGKIAPGHQEIVGRMDGVYFDGSEFIVGSFARKGNRILAQIQFVRGPEARRTDGNGYDWKRAYFHAPIPQDLPPGRYYLWLTLAEYFREDGKLIFAPKSDIRAFESFTCMFDVPDPTGKQIAWQLPGSALSIPEATTPNFAFAAVCETLEASGHFRFDDPGSNYKPGVFLTSQKVRILEVLAGDAQPGDVHLACRWTDTDTRHESVPVKFQKLIWITAQDPLSKATSFTGVKALPDTPENRQAIKDAAVAASPAPVSQPQK